AAIGCRKTRGRAKSPYHPSGSWLSATPAEARSRRSSIVLNRINPFVLRSVTLGSFPPENPWKPQGFFQPILRKTIAVGLSKLLEQWPVVRQLKTGDPLGLG